MLVIALLKGVPARTTQVVQVGGILNREAMDIVLNPHDAKAIEAADFVKRRVGGKIVALSMGPDVKLVPIMKPLYDAEVHGVDEECILSDRKMAGSDTLATSYAVALGVNKVVERHAQALEELAKAVRTYGYSDATDAKAKELYSANLLPNRVYSTLPAMSDTLVSRFMKGSITTEEVVAALEVEKASVSRFLVVSGIKTTDGETGSVGPQVAEALSEIIGKQVPHATYVDDFDIAPDGLVVESERKLGRLSQRLEMQLPALLTVSTEYRPRAPSAAAQLGVRANGYRGKVLQATKWTAADLDADPARLGFFPASPTIVGPGIDVGKPPVQKTVGKSLVFTMKTEAVDAGGQKLGPFEVGDLADGLPQTVVDQLLKTGAVATYSIQMLSEEIFS
jgi:electron transfer flavoprotein beta subunit